MGKFVGSRGVIAVGAALVLVVACGDDGGSSPSTTVGAAVTTAAPAATTAAAAATTGAPAATTAAAVATTVVAATTAAPVAEIDRDAVLRLVMNNGLNSFDPAKITGNSGFNFYYYPVYEPLIRISDATGQPEPLVAEAFEWSADGLALTVTLRDGVTFSDGTVFDAAAVKANIERYQTLEAPQARVALGSVESVEVVDPLTAVFHMSKPDSSLVFSLAQTAGMMVSPAAFENPDLDRVPVGAGPYIVTEMEPDTYVAYERNPTYWNPDAQNVARIEVRYVADATTRYNALRTGEVDGAWLGDIRLVEQAEGEGFTTTNISPDSYANLYVNFDDPADPLADVRVRQAISHAIDKAGLADVIVGGGGGRIQLYPQESPWAAPSLTEDLYPYDVDKARELLTAAGFGDGFSLTMLAPTTVFPESGALIQDMLGEVGIDVTIQPVDPATATGLFFTEKQGDLLIGLRGGQRDPAVQIAAGYLPTSRTNPAGITVPEIQDLYAQILATSDPTERTDLIHQTMVIIMDNLLDIPMTSANGWYHFATTNCVQNFPTITPLNFADASILTTC